MTIIIYENKEDSCVGLLMPAKECPLSIDAIARKDVPADAAYLIVDDNFFGDTPRDKWKANFSKPDGFGSSLYGAGTEWEVVEIFWEDEKLTYILRKFNNGRAEYKKELA